MGQGSIEALVPRGLLGSGMIFSEAPVSIEGLVAARIIWNEGLIIQIESIALPKDRSLDLLLPRLVEPHAHIDKAFSWKKFPNLKGTYEGALNTNLREYEERTVEKVIIRAEKSLDIAIKNGLRAIRTHIDSFGLDSAITWERLIDLKKKSSDLIKLQFVGLVPLEYWDSGEGNLLASRIASLGGLLGAVIAPPFKNKRTYDLIKNMLLLASKLECGVDFHIDESIQFPGLGLKQLIRVLEDFDFKIPITCSHLSSMSLLPSRQLKILADKLAKYKVNVVALPLTNAWLLGRSENQTPYKRPFAPIIQLQQAGVNVSVGGDNVQDPWFPMGNFDPISLISFSIPLAQLSPWQRLGLSPFTLAPSLMMGLDWDSNIDIGKPADFILLKGSSWMEALALPTHRKVMVNGLWLDANNSKVGNQIEF